MEGNKAGHRVDAAGSYPMNFCARLIKKIGTAMNITPDSGHAVLAECRWGGVACDNPKALRTLPSLGPVSAP